MDGSQALAHSVAHTYILTGTYRAVTYRSDHHPKTGTCPFDWEHRLDSNKALGRFRYIHHTTLRERAQHVEPIAELEEQSQ